MAYLDNADQDPERVFLGGMCQQKSRDEVVHALTICGARGNLVISSRPLKAAHEGEGMGSHPTVVSRRE